MPAIDHTRKNSYTRDALLTAARGPYRRRRITWALLIILGIIFFFGAPWEMPAEGLPAISRASIAKLVRPKTWYPTEIFGLLHFTTRDDGRMMWDDPNVDPSKPIKFEVYEKASGNWTQHVESLEKNYPLVVFSKTYCPYSKAAKALLATYDLQPPPKFVEVDKRGDGDIVKLILGRLTARATFPNVILHGKSIGGSDDLQALHNQGHLKAIFEEGGVHVQGDMLQT